MTTPSTFDRYLAIGVGGAIIFAATNATIQATGGLFTSHAVLVSSLSAGVFAGSFVIGRAWEFSFGLAIAIILGLAAGEFYNCGQTLERVVNERESAQAETLKRRMAYEEAKADLAKAEAISNASGEIQLALDAKARAEDGRESLAVTIARKAVTDAKKAVADEAKNLGCRSECNRKQGLADKAEAELAAALAADASNRKAAIAAADADVKAAYAAAEAKRADAIKKAKANLEAHPEPASGTALADRTGIAPWVLDLMFAIALSIGANGLAGALIAFGAHSTISKPEIVQMAKNLPFADAAQTDFDPAHLENVIRFFRPDGNGPSGGPKVGPGPMPRPAGPTGLSKEHALADMLERLGNGETIPSQDSLASDWGRSKQTVSDWMREWRRIGIVPAPVRVGKFNMTIAG